MGEYHGVALKGRKAVPSLCASDLLHTGKEARGVLRGGLKSLRSLLRLVACT